MGLVRDNLLMENGIVRSLNTTELYCTICQSDTSYATCEAHMKDQTHLHQLHWFRLIFEMDENSAKCKICNAIMVWSDLKVHADSHSIVPWSEPDDSYDKYEIFFKNRIIQCDNTFCCCPCDRHFSCWESALLHITDPEHQRLKKLMPQVQDCVSDVPTIYEFSVRECLIAFNSNELQCQCCGFRTVSLSGVMRHVKGITHLTSKSKYQSKLDERRASKSITPTILESEESDGESGDSAGQPFVELVESDSDNSIEVPTIGEKNVENDESEASALVTEVPSPIPEPRESDIEPVSSTTAVASTILGSPESHGMVNDAVADVAPKIPKPQKLNGGASGSIEAVASVIAQFRQLRNDSRATKTSNKTVDDKNGHEQDVQAVAPMILESQKSHGMADRVIVDVTLKVPKSQKSNGGATCPIASDIAQLRQPHANPIALNTSDKIPNDENHDQEFPSLNYFFKRGESIHYCVVCDCELTNEAIDDHAMEQSHQIALKRCGCDRITFKTGADYHCGYCERTICSLANVYEHIKGRKHSNSLNKIRSTDEQSKSIADTTFEQTTTCKYLARINPNNVRCKVCDCIIPSNELNMTSHVTGKHHNNSLKKYGCDRIIGKIDGTYYCDSCNVIIDNLGMVYVHIKDESHVKSLIVTKHARSQTPSKNDENESSMIGETSDVREIVESTTIDDRATSEIVEDSDDRNCESESSNEYAQTEMPTETSKIDDLLKKYGCHALPVRGNRYHCVYCECDVLGRENVYKHVHGKKHLGRSGGAATT